MRVADYIFKFVADKGIRHVFMVSGGGAMYLNDALRRESRLRYICNHHEQACAMAAEGYARLSNQPGVICVTSGPGGTNAITGVLGSWLDSIPMVIISGQVKRDTTIASCPHLNLRQLGDQEINIIDIVRPITKYAVFIEDSRLVRCHLEKAWRLATTGRKGPVWIDVPLDVQAEEIAEHDLLPDDKESVENNQKAEASAADMERFTAMMQSAKRPAIIAGFGIRLADAADEFLELINRWQIPVLTTFNGFDLIPTDHPLFAGRVGTIGNRSGNFVLQSADLLITVGSRNNLRQVSYNWDNFGQQAQKVVVDIDPAELQKPTLKPNLAILADAGVFIHQLLAIPTIVPSAIAPDWVAWCKERRKQFPLVPPRGSLAPGIIDVYDFMWQLTHCASANVTTVAGNGTACVTLFQSGEVKPGQRFFWNSGCASMGYDLPAALGAALACGGKVICLAGDGSIQMNIQELQTILNYQLPIKIFLLDNNGYTSIRQTQDAFFEGNRIGCDPPSGVILPDMRKIAEAYGYRTVTISNNDEVIAKIADVLNGNDPVLCVVKLWENIFAPKVASRRLANGRLISIALEDMSPFLGKDIVEKNMIRESKNKKNGSKYEHS